MALRVGAISPLTVTLMKLCTPSVEVIMTKRLYRVHLSTWWERPELMTYDFVAS